MPPTDYDRCKTPASNCNESNFELTHTFNHFVNATNTITVECVEVGYFYFHQSNDERKFKNYLKQKVPNAFTISETQTLNEAKKKDKSWTKWSKKILNDI